MFAGKINTPPPCVLEYTTAFSLCYFVFSSIINVNSFVLILLLQLSKVKSQMLTISSTMVGGLFM